MEQALGLARAAAEAGEAPVGAVIVQLGRVIAAARNRREELGDPTAHAELLAIRDAAAQLGGWRLLDTTLYVTLEPCAMCAGAVVLARIPRVVYGAADPKAGAAGSVTDLLAHPRLNHRARVTAGVLAAECGAVLVEFFASRREAGKSAPSAAEDDPAPRGSGTSDPV